MISSERNPLEIHLEVHQLIVQGIDLPEGKTTLVNWVEVIVTLRIEVEVDLVVVLVLHPIPVLVQAEGRFQELIPTKKESHIQDLIPLPGSGPEMPKDREIQENEILAKHINVKD